MNSDNTHSVKELLQNYVRKNGKQQLYAERVVIENWPQYVGEVCAKYSTCESIVNGVMRVRVTNAALRFEFMGQKTNILKRINADYAFPVVKDIVFF
ncbi:MAG: DUF721 domain-containing protein [Bacteroidales bacterium]|nr:DUF721 domain-containing protein [Bacteroidales bacterium]